MAESSGIEWTKSTFNPWIGCTKVSPGCDHCYAEREDNRGIFDGGARHWGPGAPRYRTSVQNWNKVRRWNREAGKTGEFWPVFTASLADIFDNEVPDEWRADYWQLVKECQNLTFLVLTKRVGNIKRMLPADWGDGYPNVRLGISVVNQEEADRDIPKLLQIPARCRWLSMEPLVGPVRLDINLPEERALRWYRPMIKQLDWIVVGGESGPDARAMHPDWVISLWNQCKAAGVPFLFKQWGEWKPISQGDNDWYDSLYEPRVLAKDGEDQGALNESYGRRCKVRTAVIHHNGTMLDDVTAPGAWLQGTGAMLTFRVGTKQAGRMLDGVTHDGYPEKVAA